MHQHHQFAKPDAARKPNYARDGEPKHERTARPGRKSAPPPFAHVVSLKARMRPHKSGDASSNNQYVGRTPSFGPNQRAQSDLINQTQTESLCADRGQNELRQRIADQDVHGQHAETQRESNLEDLFNRINLFVAPHHCRVRRSSRGQHGNEHD